MVRQINAEMGPLTNKHIRCACGSDDLLEGITDVETGTQTITQEWICGCGEAVTLTYEMLGPEIDGGQITKPPTLIEPEAE